MKIIIIILIMFFYGCSLNTITPVGRDTKSFRATPAWSLVNALSKGNINKANKILRDDSTLVNFKEPNYGNSVLFWAVLNDYEQAVSCLLKHGANVNDRNNKAISILHICIQYTNCESDVLKLLLENQPSNNVSQIIKNEALFVAGGYCLDKAKLLIEYKADPTCKISDPELSLVDEKITPFASALLVQNYDVIEYYLFDLKLSPELASFQSFEGETITMLNQLKEDFAKSRYDPYLQKRIKRLIEFIEKN